MKQEALKNFDVPWLPVTALLIFVICFCLYIFWTFRKENRKNYEDAGRLPLDDEQGLKS